MLGCVLEFLSGTRDKVSNGGTSKLLRANAERLCAFVQLLNDALGELEFHGCNYTSSRAGGQAFQLVGVGVTGPG